MNAHMVNARTEVNRFCSCSVVPPHIASGTEFVARPVPEADATIKAVPAPSTPAPSIVGAGESKPPRFCSCSDVPRTLAVESKQDVAQYVAIGARAESATVTKVSDASKTMAVAASETSEDPTSLAGVSDLFEGEESLYSAMTHGKGGSEIVLTNRRVVLRGAPEAPVLFSSIRLSEIDSVTISRARPNRRSLIWGLIGIVATIGMWQALDGVGNLRLIIAAVIVLVSAVLLADYALRPPDLDVSLRARSAAVMSVGFAQSRSEDAEQFAARVVRTLERRRSE